MSDLRTLADIQAYCGNLSGPAALPKVTEIIFPALKNIAASAAEAGSVFRLLATNKVAKEAELAKDFAALVGPDGGQNNGDDPAVVLMKRMEMAGVESYADSTYTPYLRFSVTSIATGTTAWHVRRADSQAVKWYLSSLSYEAGEGVPGDATIARAVNLMCWKAITEIGPREFHTRLALLGKAIWYDLTNDGWQAVRVTKKGWEVTANPPAIFRRYNHQQPQDEPVEGVGPAGVLEVLRHLSLATEDDCILFTVWLVAGFVPGIPHPIVIFHGEQGAGKTSNCRVGNALIDPSSMETLALPSNTRELVQILEHHWLAPFDNISSLREDTSNTLCRAVTGGGFSKRALYTNDDDIVYSYRRLIMLNGINNMAIKPDLLDRAILISVDRIAPGRRKPDSVFWREFMAVRPRILGGMFDALTAAMKLVPNVELPTMPRMADFAVWGFAIAEVLGFGGQAFLDAYERNIAKQNDVALDASPVAMAVRALLADPKLVTSGEVVMSEKGRRVWRGQPSDLLKRLEFIAHDIKLNIRGRDWPKDPRTVGEKLTEVKTNLANAGITFVIGKSNGTRFVTLTQLLPDLSPAGEAQPSRGAQGAEAATARDVAQGAETGAGGNDGAGSTGPWLALFPGPKPNTLVAANAEGAVEITAADGLPSFVADALADTLVTKVVHGGKPVVKLLQDLGHFASSTFFDTALADQLIAAGNGEGDTGLEVLLARYGVDPDSVGADGGLGQLYGRLVAALAADGLGEVGALEFAAMPVIAAIERAGLALDVEAWRATARSAASERDLAKIEALKAFTDGGVAAPNLGSAPQLRDALAGLGIHLTSVRAADLKTAMGQHPVIGAILRYRKLDKAVTSFGEATADLADPATSRLHGTFTQMVDTGRMSSSGPNLQNIPADKRAYFIAPGGYKIITSDYSQIELRILAQRSGDTGLIAAFADGEDLHRLTAARMFGIELPDVTDAQRKQAKAINFGLVYGKGAKQLGIDLGITEDRAHELVKAHFEAFPGIKAWLDGVADEAAATGEAIRSFSGRRRRFEFDPGNRQALAAIKRQAKNFPMQAGCADILKEALVRVHTALANTGANIVNAVHDEIVVEAPSDEADAVAATVECEMVAAAARWLTDVPVTVDVRVADAWRK